MLDLAALGREVARVYDEMHALYFILVPVFVLCGITISWFKSPIGSIEILDILKRVAVSAVLLSAFPEICDALLAVTQGIAAKIGNLENLNNYFNAVANELERAGTDQSGSSSLSSMLFSGISLIPTQLVLMAVHLILVVAKFLMLSLYHFIWSFMIMCGPLVLAVYVILPGILASYFQILLEVSSWKILWAALGMFLNATPFMNTYSIESGWFTHLASPVLVGVFMLVTPLVSRALLGGTLPTLVHGIAAMWTYRKARSAVGNKVSGLSHAGSRSTMHQRGTHPVKASGISRGTLRQAPGTERVSKSAVSAPRRASASLSENNSRSVERQTSIQDSLLTPGGSTNANANSTTLRTTGQRPSQNTSHEKDRTRRSPATGRLQTATSVRHTGSSKERATPQDTRPLKQGRQKPLTSKTPSRPHSAPIKRSVPKNRIGKDTTDEPRKPLV